MPAVIFIVSALTQHSLKGESYNGLPTPAHAGVFGAPQPRQHRCCHPGWSRVRKRSLGRTELALHAEATPHCLPLSGQQHRCLLQTSEEGSVEEQAACSGHRDGRVQQHGFCLEALSRFVNA